MCIRDSYTNAAGLGGGLDSDKIYTLSWDWKLDSTSTSQQLGFLGSGFAPNQSRDIVWIASDDSSQVTLRVEHGGVQEFFDFAMPFPFDDPARFEIVVDGVDNVVYGSVDGQQSIRFFLTEQEIADIQLLQMRTDNGPGRRFPQTDNILLTTAIAPVSWGVYGNGDWDVGSNWNIGNDPDGTDARAIFAAAITAPATVTVAASRTVGALELDNANSYTISHATNTRTLQTSAGSASVEVLQGNHNLNIDVQAASDTNVNVAATAALTWGGPVTIAAGKTLTVTGGGKNHMTGSLSFGAGAGVQVGAGELNLNLSQAGSGTSNINVSAAGALTGGGDVPASVNVDGILAPGTSGTATTGIFFEDFEVTTDSGYTSGALLDTQNGWSVMTASPILPIGDGDSDFTGQFLDGWAAASGPDTTIHDNLAGLTGPLDPNELHRLSWDWKLDSQSHNQTIGLTGTSASLTGDALWLALAGGGGVEFRFRPDGGSIQEFLVPMTTPFTDPKKFEIVIDGVTNEIYGVIDDVEVTPRWAITDSEISALDGLRLFTDNGPSRRFPQTDNIFFDATLAGADGPPLGDVATMNISGSAVFGSTASLAIDLAGNLAGEFDVLNLSLIHI